MTPQGLSLRGQWCTIESLDDPLPDMPRPRSGCTARLGMPDGNALSHTDDE